MRQVCLVGERLGEPCREAHLFLERPCLVALRFVNYWSAR